MTSRPRTVALRSVAITMVLVTTAIHAELVPMHLHEKFYVGVLFAIGSCAFLVATLGLMIQRVRALGWLLAVLIAVGMIGGYLASRTVGLPLGYHEGFGADPENLLGYVCLAAELGIVGCAAATLAVSRSQRQLPPPATVSPGSYARAHG